MIYVEMCKVIYQEFNNPFFAISYLTSKLCLQDKLVQEIMINGGQTVTITIMPTFVYEHIVKRYVMYYTLFDV